MAPIAPPKDTPQSLFHLERISQYVSLSPASLASPLPSLCVSIFSPLLLSYYAPARGIVLAYQDVEISEAPPTTITPGNGNAVSGARGTKRKRKGNSLDGQIQDARADTESEKEGESEVLLKVIDEYSAPFLWATATLLILRPSPSTLLTAKISHQASTHITLSYLNAFAISVLKAHMPRAWRWHGSGSGANSERDRAGKRGRGRHADEGDGAVDGYWVDGDGMPVPDVLGVWIRDWDAKSGGRGRGFLRVEGSLVRPGAEDADADGQAGTQTQEKEKEQDKRRDKERGKKKTKSALRNGGARANAEGD
ncbi:hypothetical protein K491DRAFT_691826 [Lophiostoma macrostomum CBS 122681]|uniref:RPA43 OB domain-containing protein n=1 Tax=Lophiostoma macrostomum CBS 122681 TaxID=1314788 RepID=A0A6A6T9E9_9PLEO|nr:hypothetical protein K491DRAFT_691826 [Lophiostoma macrostomum CBS 122681]